MSDGLKSLLRKHKTLEGLYDLDARFGGFVSTIEKSLSREKSGVTPDEVTDLIGKVRETLKGMTPVRVPNNLGV